VWISEPGLQCDQSAKLSDRYIALDMHPVQDSDLLIGQLRIAAPSALGCFALGSS